MSFMELGEHEYVSEKKLPKKCPDCYGYEDSHTEGCKRMPAQKVVSLEEFESRKDTNPKDAVGVKKAPVSTVSGAVIAELGLAMLEGARKYGRHNYRVAGVRASVYRDAAFRHLNEWWEGQDIDPDSGLSHITKAIASLCVLRDAMIMGNWTDDRPPPLPEDFLRSLNAKAAEIIEKYPEAKDPFTKEST